MPATMRTVQRSDGRQAEESGPFGPGERPTRLADAGAAGRGPRPYTSMIDGSSTLLCSCISSRK